MTSVIGDFVERVDFDSYEDFYKNTKDIDLKIKLNDSLNNDNKYLFVDVMNKNEKEKWENHLCISPGDIYNYFKVFSNEIIEF